MILVKKPPYICIIILLIILFSLFSNVIVVANPQPWSNDYSFMQKINVPIDTSTNISKYQPVDMNILLDNPCWAKDEQNHSIRICCLKENNWFEMESQIYDLQHTDSDQITSCNIVFLIPEIADGSEEYYVFYDEQETDSPNYTDHINYVESSYFYEPISGYPLQSDYLEIRDDGIITYMISYQGQFMGYNTCQHVYRMIDGTTELLPKNAELFAAFDFKYCYDDGLFEYSSTSQELVSKDVVTDGNLMIQLKMESVSKRNDLKTTATYKYYHCPADNKQIHVHVIHEALKDITVYEQANTDGAYLSMQAGGVKSKSIDELNIGEILPYFHFVNELNNTISYPLDIDPEYIKDDLDLRLISIKDDIDLADEAWVSFDEGDAGKVHALFIHYDESDFKASDERSGLQINAFQMDYPHLAGLENNIATVQIGRNSIEQQNDHDLKIPKDFYFEFDAAFFSSSTGGVKKAQSASTVFQNLAQIKPDSTNDTIEKVEKKITHDLTVFVHNEASFPFGSSLSAALGLNFSYITVELFKFEKFVYSQNAIRLPLNALEDLEEEAFLKKLFMTFSVFDIRNSSIFKKAIFSDIEEGNYLVKVFKEHPLFNDEKEFIAYAIVDLNEDERIHVFSKKESFMNVQLIDQHQHSISDATILLQDSGFTISSSVTDEDGFAQLKAPINTDGYELCVLYSDILVFKESVKLPFFPRIRPLEKEITVNTYDLEVIVKDTWDQLPYVDLQPVLFTYEDDSEIRIKPSVTNEKIIFKNIPGKTYELKLTYNAFTYEETLKINDDKTILVDFQAEFPVTISIRNTRGENLSGTRIEIQRGKKTVVFDEVDSDHIISLPTGEYLVTIYDDQTLIGKQCVEVYGDKLVVIITNKTPLYPLIIGIIIAVITGLYLAYALIAANKKYLLTIIIISLLIFSLFLPWWQLQGKSSDINTSTTLFLIPQTMISTYETNNSITGENAFLPEEIHLLFSAILIATILVSILLMTTQFLKNNSLLSKKLYFMLTLISVFLLTASLSGFFLALSEVSRISVGSIIGSGTVSFGVPGESVMYNISCSWGVSFGFYLYLASFLLLIGPSIYKRFKRLRNDEP